MRVYLLHGVRCLRTTPDPQNQYPLRIDLIEVKTGRTFRRDWEIYEVTAKIYKEVSLIQVAAFKNVVGNEALDMLETFDWDDESDKSRIEVVAAKVEERCVLKSMRHSNPAIS